MYQSVKDIVDHANGLFSDRQQFISLWQEIAENFMPTRADFTGSHIAGNDLASNLKTSYPLLLARDLTNTIGAMLRPKETEWFSPDINVQQEIDIEAQRYMESIGYIMRRAMYDPDANFSSATKQADADYAIFGQAVISCEFSKKTNSLLYRNWHLRDVAWCESVHGRIDKIFRRWKPTISGLKELFGDNIHESLKQKLRGKDGHKQKVNVIHAIIPAESWAHDSKIQQPFISLFIDCDNNHIMEEKGSVSRMYAIPRAQRVGCSPYAYSIATVAALPDTRLLQQLSYIMLQAGELAIEPPMIGKEGALRSDLALYSSAVTWVDSEYDERFGEALRPIQMDKSGLAFGLDLIERTKNGLYDAFMLNKVALPPMAQAMTATEVSFRVQEYIRQALPLFEPMESEYNGQLCDITFDVLSANGAFGSPDIIPESLSGKDIRFKFRSPLTEAMEKQKAARFQELSGIIAGALPVYEDAAALIDFKVTIEDVLQGIGIPSKWIKTRSEFEADKQAKEDAIQTQQLLANIQQGAQTAQQVGQAGQALQAIGVDTQTFTQGGGIAQ